MPGRAARPRKHRIPTTKMPANVKGEYDVESRPESNPRRIEGILLLGPTGGGKSPLGEALAASGWKGRRCLHFDFGNNLRSAADGKICDFSTSETRFVRQLLTAGKLLENDTFYLAERILRSFMKTNNAGPDDLIVLNGLPRHVSQARDTDGIVEINNLVQLQCAPEVITARLRTNAGGDRTGRIDDDPELVRRKLRIYRQRTLPLIQYYQQAGARIHTLAVGAETNAEIVLARLISSVT